MTRKQLAEAIFDLEAEKFGFDPNNKAVHVNGMLNGCGFVKAMKKAELEQRLNDLQERKQNIVYI